LTKSGRSIAKSASNRKRSGAATSHETPVDEESAPDTGEAIATAPGDGVL